jgi:hypothetical protein
VTSATPVNYTFSATATGPGGSSPAKSAGASVQGTLAWSAGQPVEPPPPGGWIVSCTSATLCAGADGYGQVSIFDGARWSTPATVDPDSGFVSLSCAGGFCLAVDGQGGYVTYDGSSWSAPLPGPTGITLASCSSASSCVGILSTSSGWESAVYSGGSSAWSTSLTSIGGSSSGGRIGFVSCATANFCEAADTGGIAFTYDGTSWTSEHVSSSTIFFVSSLSCVAAGFCVLAADPESVFILSGGTWTEQSVSDPSDLPFLTSCGSTKFCEAVTDGGAYTFDGSAWSQANDYDLYHPSSLSCAAGSCFAVSSDSLSQLYTGGVHGDWGLSTEQFDTSYSVSAISCVTGSDFCAAVDTAGNAFTSTGSGWNETPGVDPNGFSISSISCPNSLFCMAVDHKGDFATYSSGSWSSPSPTKISDNLMSTFAVSCASDSFCVAVEGEQAAVFDGRTWQKAVNVDTTSGDQDLDSVSCASPSFCMALDLAGYGFVFDGTSWSGQILVDKNAIGYEEGGGVETISCGSAQLCVAVGDDGFAETSTTGGTTWTKPRDLDSMHQLTDVSYAVGASVCSVSGEGVVYTGEDDAWSATTPDPAVGRALVGVACSSAYSCVALDDANTAFLGTST